MAINTIEYSSQNENPELKSQKRVVGSRNRRGDVDVVVQRQGPPFLGQGREEFLAGRQPCHKLQEHQLQHSHLPSQWRPSLHCQSTNFFMCNIQRALKLYLLTPSPDKQSQSYSNSKRDGLQYLVGDDNGMSTCQDATSSEGF